MDTTPKHLLKERLLLLERKAADLPPSSAPWWRTEAAVVAAGSAAVVVASTAERLAFKAMVDAMPPYRYFLAQLITVAYVPLMSALAWWRVRYNDGASGIGDEMAELPKRRFALMGLLDMLSCVVLTVAAGEVRAPLTVLLLQAQLPLQALLSAVFLRVRYRASHALGVALVLAGVLVNMGPSFADMHSGAWRRKGGAGEGAAGAAGAGAGAGAAAGGAAAFGAANLTATGGIAGFGGGGGSNPWFTLAYLLAAVPAACSAAYKESCLRATPIDMYYLNAWSSLFQFVFGLFAAPVVLKDSLGMAQEVQGVGACLRGEGWISGGNGAAGGVGGEGGGGCAPAAPWLLAGNILSTLALHQALTFLVRRNAAAVYIATSVAVATAYLGLELYAQQRGETAFALVDTLALLAAMGGFVAVRWSPEPDITVVTELIPERQAPSFQ
jgi:uncharacterized membrane protein